jgi:hypothetical protein
MSQSSSAIVDFPQRQRHIDALLDDQPVMRRIREAMIAAVAKAFDGPTPRVIPGMAAYNGYSYGVDFLARALAEYGFIHECEGNQSRVFCPSRYEVGVRIRVARGTRVQRGVRLNAEKGPETAEGIRQNAYHFRLQKALPTFEDPIRPEKILNVFLIWNSNGKLADVHLALGTQLRGGTKLECDECQHIIVAESLASIVEFSDVETEIAVSQPSPAEYSFEGFEEKTPEDDNAATSENDSRATGTE